MCVCDGGCEHTSLALDRAYRNSTWPRGLCPLKFGQVPLPAGPNSLQTEEYRAPKAAYRYIPCDTKVSDPGKMLSRSLSALCQISRNDHIMAFLPQSVFGKQRGFIQPVPWL